MQYASFIQTFNPTREHPCIIVSSWKGYIPRCRRKRWLVSRVHKIPPKSWGRKSERLSFSFASSDLQQNIYIYFFLMMQVLLYLYHEFMQTILIRITGLIMIKVTKRFPVWPRLCILKAIQQRHQIHNPTHHHNYTRITHLGPHRRTSTKVL